MERVEMRPAKDLVRVRCPTCSGWVMRKRAKLEEEVAGGGAMGGVGITKLPKTKPKPDEDKEMVADAGAKEERTKKEKSPKPEKKMVADAGAKEERTKKKRTKKEKRTKKVLSPKPDEKEMAADTGSEEEDSKSMVAKKEKSPKPEKKMVADAGAKEERTKKKRTKKVLSPKPDEKEMAADTGSEEGDSKTMAQPAGCGKRTKMVPRRLSKVFVENLLNYPPPPLFRNLPVDGCHYFVSTTARDIAAAEKDARDFTAFILDQYRSYGYAELPEEVTDDEEEV